MKILAFGDLHGSKESIDRIINKSKSSDILVCCGDVTVLGFGMEKILKEFRKAKKTVLIIHGNHESSKEMKDICRKIRNVEFIHKKHFEYDGFIFLGYGGGGFEMENPDFEKYIRKYKNKIKNKKIILVTHGPPHKTKLDYLPWIGHVGCKTMRKCIQEIKPVLHICGHLHENESKTDKIRNTLIINPGEKGKVITLNEV